MPELAPTDPRRIDGYDIHSRLGTGGFGTVYRATSPTGTEVALKVLRPELADNHLLRERLAREGFAIRKVQGNRTVKVLDVVTEGQSPYLVMELLEGEDLESYVTNRGPVQGPFLWSFIEGLVEAISDIHKAGIVHRDLKPSNVFFGPDGVKVLDFGVSAVAEQTALTQTGAFVGTAAWLSPEQVQTGNVGPESDLFNLGLVVAYLATGSHPFGSGRADAVMYRICNSEPNLTYLTDPVRELVSRCLEKEEHQRPTITDLQAFLNSDGQSWTFFSDSENANDDESDVSSQDTKIDGGQEFRTRVVQRPLQVEVPVAPETEPQGISVTHKPRRAANAFTATAILGIAIVAWVVFASGSKQSEMTISSANAATISSSSVPSQDETAAEAPPSTDTKKTATTAATSESSQAQPVTTSSTPALPQVTNQPIQVSTTNPPSASTTQPAPTTEPTPTSQAPKNYSLTVSGSSCGDNCILFTGIADFPDPIDNFNGLNITHHNSPGMTGASSLSNRWPSEDRTSWRYEMFFRFEGVVSCQARWDFGLSFAKDGTNTNDRTPRASISNWSGILSNC